MKVWKIAGISALALALVLALALPALAAPDWMPFQTGRLPRMLRGEVVSINGGLVDGEATLVIQSGDGEVTISVDGETRYFKVPVSRELTPLTRLIMTLREHHKEGLRLGKQNSKRLRIMEWNHPLEGRVSLFFRASVPGRVSALARHRLESGEQAQQTKRRRFWHFGEEATFDDITVGGRVGVLAVGTEDNLLAKLVFIVEPTVYNRVLGNVTEILPGTGTITIDPVEEGDEVILGYDDGTRFFLRGSPALAVGELVRAVYDEDNMAKVVAVVVEGLD
jgi:hypothetical protein